jgi:hypothetical protein
MLSQLQWREEFLLQDFTRVDRLVNSGHGVPLSVVVDDLHIRCTGVGPAEADSPLLVDSYAVLASPVSFQLLQAVAGRDPEVIQVLGGVEKQQLPMGRSLQFWTKQLGAFPFPDPLRLFVGEGPEHLREHNVSR